MATQTSATKDQRASRSEQHVSEQPPATDLDMECHKAAPDGHQELDRTSDQTYFRKTRMKRMWIRSQLLPHLLLQQFQWWWIFNVAPSRVDRVNTLAVEMQHRQDSVRDTINSQMEAIRITMDSMSNTLKEIQKEDRHTIMDTLQILTTSVCKLVYNSVCQSAAMDSMAANQRQTAASSSLSVTSMQLMKKNFQEHHNHHQDYHQQLHSDPHRMPLLHEHPGIDNINNTKGIKGCTQSTGRLDQQHQQDLQEDVHHHQAYHQFWIRMKRILETEICCKM
ncbi:uncharacterized protein LOC134932122 [Pseudophryne corroboree]|uniref:uncharacterized protein LOC134932122 n=1 Tax=Pseudophryne corroboree TaxID=495146 RepID=UPI0030820CB7